MMIRKSFDIGNGLKVTVSPSGIGFSAKVGKTRVTKHADGKKSVSVNLGHGLRYTKKFK